MLIIEDDELIRETLEEVIRAEGVLVEGAPNGKEALDLLRSKPDSQLPSLILLDVMMPVMDGYQFRTEQLADPRLKDIPTVVISADGHIEEKAKKLNIDRYLRKPIELEQLLELIH